MKQFQENLQSWFLRSVPLRATNECNDFSLILSSDIGLKREENQDRVSAIYTGDKYPNPLLAITVVDGMGGMRDGAICASLAISAFYFALVQHRHSNLHDRAIAAIKYANHAVNELWEGKGGATLSSVLIDKAGLPLIVHVGDTRVYSFDNNSIVKRHTSDDSFAEAVGGGGRELLQFIGMGESMQPAVIPLSTQNRLCAITTDGIHYVEEKTLDSVLTNASNLKQASERLSTLARWCGGHDNASSAIFDLVSITEKLAKTIGSGVKIWDAYGNLSILWGRDEELPANQGVHNLKPVENIPATPIENSKASNKKKLPRKRKLPTKKIEKKKTEDFFSDNIQLNIEIKNSTAEKKERDTND